MYSLTIDTAPTVEPVTLTDLKDQLRITTTDEDSYLTALITAARRNVEHILGRSLITQTWNLYLDNFPASANTPISLLKPPLQSVTWVKYWDNNDTEQTWTSSEYVVDTDNICGLVYPDRTYNWPSVRDFPKAVNIKFVAGYGLAVDVPQDIKQAILLIIGHLERNREHTTGMTLNEIPMGANAILAPYKIHNF